VPRKRKEKPEEIAPQVAEEHPLEIPQEFLNDSDRMLYILILGLLAKMGGTVRLTAKDLEKADDDCNVIYSVTASGKALEVTAVPPQSGILRSPTKRKVAETVRLPDQIVYQPLPIPGRLPDAYTPEQIARLEDTLHNGGFIKDSQDKPKIVFPFETGNRPEDTRPLTLNDSAQKLLQRDQQVAAEQAEAAARVEAES
jgi:hypothetical protein